MKKTPLKKVLLLGSGGLRIGQAGEFDYSGSQAIKALKEEKISCVLVNPNIATVQTDAMMADEVYLQPLSVPVVTRIIEKEKPDGVLLGFGGQTALNLGLKLEELGVFKKHGVRVLGTSVNSIRMTEDRELFKESLEKIGIKSPKSYAASTIEQAVRAAREIGYPVMMRAGFSLGGLGSGRISDEAELKYRAKEALSGAPQILIEEYLTGWKELEYEIVRDAYDNAVTICNMENIDPMGIHTGESIVVAPSQTLTNQEYHSLREIAIRAARNFNIVGECNIQYALNPANGDYRVIEMNARLSRSSALASKATGYPLAFVAAKLALGFRLSDIKNTITKKTCAFFEPALDYIVVKVPRWDTHKLRSAERTIGSEMKSVGEVMAIGRSFPEAIQKAVRMLNIGASSISDYPHPIEDAKKEISQATDRRLFALYKFFREGGSVDEAARLSHIDRWFLHQIHALSLCEKKIEKQPLSKELLLEAKKSGFSDRTIAKLKKLPEESVRKQRIKMGVIPFIKQIDTLAGEFKAETNYLYLTYHAQLHDIAPSTKRPVVVLGSGPYSIGSSVEFDWCAVNTARALRKLKEQTIIINSNPETVSTDYDESDRLYFEELSLERVRDIADFERPKGVIVSVGGQIANNLAMPLHEAGYPLLGTSATSIDIAENRQKFSALLQKLKIDQPHWEKVTSLDNAKKFAEKVGYPLLIRPSYVLSGSAMNVVATEQELTHYLKEALRISPDHPVVISQFITDAKELEVDGIAQNGEIVIEAMTEHIENAGVHSGDATVVLPPQRLYLETIRRAKKITQEIVKNLAITGPFNMQFIAKNNALQVIECNVRASRSFPFVSKVTDNNFIEISTQVMMKKHKPKHYETLELSYVGVKAPQFSYQRLKGADPVAHVEMASTGEVACLGGDLLEAFFSSWLATDQKTPKKRLLVSIGGDKKVKLLDQLRILEEKGWELYATEGTHDYLSKHGIASICLYKASERIEPNVMTLIAGREIDLIINIPRTTGTNHRTDGYKIRRLSIDHHLPLITNLQIAQIFLQCLGELNPEKIPVRSWREYLEL
ncbi:MAG: carbamoyl-phosphate synthase (glutamine-hydrolyzing) large subunit [Chlamydiales bacterium]|nr:carbamoyl-phosphate synthase (glutamine-hydrolyzing) large subunit [Chlamydiales bacterium]